ncbi:MAG: uroporphyrinogen decarboxylase family protein [bacterium]
MNREYFIDLTKKDVRVPIGVDMILHQYSDVDAILDNGVRMGKVLLEAARFYNSPIVMPHMDLMLEKDHLLSLMGIPVTERPTYHFQGCPSESMVAEFKSRIRGSLSPRMEARNDAIRYVATHSMLLPMGISIGPFSLMTKLLADPITPIFLAGSGITSDEDPEVKAVEVCLDLALDVVLRAIESQLDAGARTIVIAEPAANSVYLSPRQMEEGSDIYDRFVLTPNSVMRKLVADRGAALIFHNCGALTPEMIRKLDTLRPEVFSFGSPVQLCEAADLVSKDTVLYGNLPSKRFMSDSLITVEQVKEMSRDLAARMREKKHPFMLGTECDVLCVHEHKEVIARKVEAFMTCSLQ